MKSKKFQVSRRIFLVLHLCLAVLRQWEKVLIVKSLGMRLLESSKYPTRYFARMLESVAKDLPFNVTKAWWHHLLFLCNSDICVLIQRMQLLCGWLEISLFFPWWNLVWRSDVLLTSYQFGPADGGDSGHGMSWWFENHVSLGLDPCPTMWSKALGW